MRDVFLGTNPFWMLDPWYAIATIAALPVVMVFRRYLVRLEGTFYIFDAIGLALFVNVGIYKTLMLGHPMWVALIMGTITGSMGGVLRDIFINEVPLVFRMEIYAYCLHCWRYRVLADWFGRWVEHCAAVGLRGACDRASFLCREALRRS